MRMRGLDSTTTALEAFLTSSRCPAGSDSAYLRWLLFFR